MIVGVWVPAPFGALLFFVCCLVLSVRGKIRIFDRGMCTSSLRLVLSFVFATYFCVQLHRDFNASLSYLF